jgi:DNA-directed RNA polymerase subunit RPC12/RpoP
MDGPIYLSDNYRSGFLLRVKKINGKTNSVWFEVSSHNPGLDTTLNELANLAKEMGLEQDITFRQPNKFPEIKLPKPQEPKQNHKQEPKKSTEIKNWRYVCMSCGFDIPAFEKHDAINNLYCAKCKKWRVFEKKLPARAQAEGEK